VERSEAEAIYVAGREAVVEALLALSARLEAQDAQLAALAERVEELEQRVKRDSSKFVVAAEPRSAVAGQAGTVAGDGAEGRRAAGPRRSRPVAISDGARDGGSRPLAGALRVRPSLRR
jgi:hypothetical protein